MKSKPFKIGLCGSHRTGKTTLAKAVAEHLNIPFIQTNTSQVFHDHGLKPSSPMDFKTRLWIQHKVVDAGQKVWESRQGDFITDRTPIDMMAYTLCDVQGTTQVDFYALKRYMTHCFQVTNRLFSSLIIIQPGIPLVYETGKAALNEAYMEHLNVMIIGLCSQERSTCPFFILQRDIVDLQDRIDTILTAIYKQSGH